MHPSIYGNGLRNSFYNTESGLFLPILNFRTYGGKPLSTIKLFLHFFVWFGNPLIQTHRDVMNLSLS